jgi:hypothetical protein
MRDQGPAVPVVPPPGGPAPRPQGCWRQWTGALGLVAALAVASVAGCGSGRLVLPITLGPAASVPADERGRDDHAAVVRGLAAMMAREHGLPFPEQVTVYVYSSRRVFEQGLIQDAHVSPVRAAELSDFAVGIGKRRQLLLNDEGARGREWLRLIAHELCHVAQIELSEGEGRAEQWLAEGMAEWVAFSVLERLGLDTLAHRRAVSAAGIRNHAALAAARLDLESLGTPRGFTVRHLREGSLPTYQLAFLMADYLIAREGFDRVVGYFRLFGKSLDRRANFEQAFGQPLEAFEREVLPHLSSLVR